MLHCLCPKTAKGSLTVSMMILMSVCLCLILSMAISVKQYHAYQLMRFKKWAVYFLAHSGPAFARQGWSQIPEDGSATYSPREGMLISRDKMWIYITAELEGAYYTCRAGYSESDTKLSIGNCLALE